MKKLLSIAFIVLLITSSAMMSSYASSSGDDDDSGGSGAVSGGGGGGSPDFFDYFIPLIFNSSHEYGTSEVVVWIVTPTVVITSFAQNDFGSNIDQVREPKKLVFNPDDNPGLTNGSLIRTTQPVQIVGQRVTEDVSSDQSFSYSILPRRMMGFEYYAPFDGTITLLTLNPNTRIQASSPGGSYQSTTIDLPGRTATIPITKGTYINSSFPTIGAFYTTNEGMSASLAVPRYLHGSNYTIPGDLTAERSDEIDLSYLTITPSEPTQLSLYYKGDNTTRLNIFGPTTVSLNDGLQGFSSSRGTLEANLRVKFAYGGTIRSSTIQLMAIEEMRSGEIFSTPKGYSTHFGIGRSETEFNFSRYDPDTEQLVGMSRQSNPKEEKYGFSISSTSDDQFIMATDYLFAFSLSPGRASHPMAPSVGFVNIPLNRATQRDISGLKATWYRFANLAVTDISLIPGPAEEYTGQIVRVEITANGSLPASQFKVTVEIDSEMEIEETYDFLPVNESIVYEIRKFLPVGKKKLNISVNVDIDDQVNEINEDDNNVDLGLNVQINIRLRFTVFAVFIALISYGGYRLRNWMKQRSDVNRAHVDAILTFEEEEA